MEGAPPSPKKKEVADDESEARVFVFSYLRAGHAMVRTPTIVDVKTVCSADQKELVTFVTVNCTLQDRAKLNLSSMTKADLLRHALAIATSSSSKIAPVAQLHLTPYSTCSDEDLLMLLVERRLILSTKSAKVKMSRDQMLRLVASRSSISQHDAIVVTSVESEKCRRAVTERCLLVIQEHFEDARYEEECKRFLDWAKRDTLAHKDAAMLLNRIQWLDSFGNIPFASDVAKYLARHVVPFLLVRPDLILSDHGSWRVLRIDRALRHPSVAKATINGAEEGFFARIGKFNDSQLREPQRLALEALCKSNKASHLKDDDEDSEETEEEELSAPAVATTDDDLATEYNALIALRLWFARVLEATFSRDTQHVVPLQEGERIFAAFANIKARLSELPRMIILPTGVGKSGVICLAPFFFGGDKPVVGRVLVVCPTIEIRQQMAATFTTFYAQRVGIDPSDVPEVTEICGSDWRWDQFKDFDVFVATFHRFVGNRLLSDFPRLLFDLILVDEAHHAEALTYRLLREHFCKAQYVYFTGTPYRSDHVAIRAELIYSCTMREALERENPYIKHLCYLPLPVKSMTLIGASSQHDSSQQQERTFGSFQEVVENASEIRKVFSRSMEAHSHVIGFIIWKVRQMRKSSGVHHQAILQAADMSDAAVLVHLWNSHPENARGAGGLLTIAAVHSQMPREESAVIIDRLKAEKLDAIVHVGMIGEGFDHPHLSVCGIFRRFASMPPFVQFVGRALRRIPNCSNKNDNVGFVIAHPGLGLHKHWDLYKKEVELPDDADLALNGSTSSFEWTDITETYSYDDSQADWF
jgi:superfamily II DNA or RNA helicase